MNISGHLLILTMVGALALGTSSAYSETSAPSTGQAAKTTAGHDKALVEKNSGKSDKPEGNQPNGKPSDIRPETNGKGPDSKQDAHPPKNDGVEPAGIKKPAHRHQPVPRLPLPAQNHPAHPKGKGAMANSKNGVSTPASIGGAHQPNLAKPAVVSHNTTTEINNHSSLAVRPSDAVPSAMPSLNHGHVHGPGPAVVGGLASSTKGAAAISGTAMKPTHHP